MTDVRKAGSGADPSRTKRPQTLSRKATPQVLHKLGKSPRDREREWEEERWCDDERDTFPQYCMTCEKQFITQDERCLYCSDSCRKHDQSATVSSHSYNTHDLYNNASLPFYAAGNPEPRDIIPRASPSRPGSTYFSPPTTPTSSQYPTAVSALRSLNRRPPSPPSPVYTNASIWPFARSAATSPSTSYTKPSHLYSSTYDGGYATSGYTTTSDRPLPSRNHSIYSRPKSIELVTPMISR
ncbi:hypothetical protein F5Y16DRAFT_395725 [Xylariaceae sp. FL0255]|nr:hypothetical protein F5Y16DRAFT_395725 [Xylariaceae sp. FL0255]